MSAAKNSAGSTGQKLMVANRSEIACRIFQGAREMGIATLAIYAPGDEGARHVTLADEVAEVPSYLNAEAIIEVARKHGVTLIHPGYGFLSERPHFARLVEGAGISFLGPKAETMEQMGGKIAAKEIAEKHKIPTVPWAKLDLAKTSEAELKKTADGVGYPLLIKAHAGGGGKGMRRVDKFEQLKPEAETAAREAVNAFGDGTLFFEKLVENPRHIEVQVLGDGQGGGIHLHERECTLQRRHQKVWEEAPAPHLSDKTRQGLFESSLKLVSVTEYRSAGTIEYLVDQEGNYYFIEMNTRLQVEHPVTESVTGVDLVHEQIKIALQGDSYELPRLTPPHGHAIEVRIYAEDPAQGFIPSTGKVNALIWPSGPGIRLDRGIEVGQEMGTSFDSMCAKLIVHAPNRDVAVRRMQYALAETVVSGVGTNLEYLNQIAHSPKVIDGRVTTHFLDKEFASFKPAPTVDEIKLAALMETKGLATHGGAGSTAQSQSIWSKAGASL
ncbi:MAG: ATP-grasp domain-containing protein [Bdellovibrionales bacterium]|nr:ATP-grasp domain-containing protein [Bdellovibrionales bacterium]